MKRLLTILCLVLLSSCSQEPEVITGPVLIRDDVTYHQDTNEPITGVVEVFHDNGQLEIKGNFKDGKQHGLWEEFHEDGQLWWRLNFKDGKQDGLSEGFHDNGQLKVREHFIDGEIDGLWELFDRDGNLTGTQTYRNGVVVEENFNP